MYGYYYFRNGFRLFQSIMISNVLVHVKLNVYWELSLESNGNIYVHFAESVGYFPQEISRESAIEKKSDPNLFLKNRF